MRWVSIYRSGSLLDVGQRLVAGVGAESAPALARPRIGPLPCPLRGACALAIEWPRAGEASVDILDAAGRRVHGLFRGHIEEGRQEYRIDASGLGSGIYFLRARERGAAAVRRFVVVR